VTYAGVKHTFNFSFHDPWKWILDLVTDPTLASSIIWYPVKKILHENGKTTGLYDDIHSGQLWWDIQVCFVFSFSFYALTVEKDQMPQVDNLPHCFLPLHFWTDKGKVSTTTTMHPMLA